MNENESQIDLYALRLLRLVADHRGFTAAAKEAGISQSALTRQVQGLEDRLGLKVFERTTRSVSLTEAGAVFLRETEALPHILEGALRRVREEYLEAPREVKIGLSMGLALAHIPGIFHKEQQGHLGERIYLTQFSDQEILEQVSRSPRGSWARELIEGWAKRHHLKLNGNLELENFDLINEFVALGFGVALVPRRSLTSLMRKHRVSRLPLPHKLSRQLIAVVPKHGTTPDYVREFVSGILFS